MLTGLVWLRNEGKASINLLDASINITTSTQVEVHSQIHVQV